jgi:hypothetical protein
MFQLFFGDLFSILTAVAVLGMLAIIALTIVNRNKIEKWGWLIFLFIIVGTAISGLAAMRDAYMTAQATFSVSSMQSTLCSLAGGLIFLSGFLALFVKKQTFRRFGFYFISVLFITQVLIIEVSRIVTL